jgi:hypothetical protein
MTTTQLARDWKMDDEVLALKGECEFNIVVKDFKATELTTRHR